MVNTMLQACRSRRGFPAAILLLLPVIVGTHGEAQVVRPAGQPRQPSWLRPSLVLLGGYGLPLSRESLTEFWNGGASGSVQFTVPVQRYLSLGMGIDGMYLPFDKPAFAARYGDEADSIPSSTMGLFSISLLSRWVIAPRYRFTPYAVAGVGATHITGAVYKEKVSGVTRRYYDVPKKTRLSVTIAAGMEFGLSSWMALEVEARGVYVHSDDDLGFFGHLMGGFRFRM